MTSALIAIAPKLSKLIRLLGSDEDGAAEVWEAQQFNGPLPPATECLVTAVRRIPGMRVRFHTPVCGLRAGPEDATEKDYREFFLSLFLGGVGMSDAPLHAGDTLEAIYNDRRYVCWAWEPRPGGESTKVPYEPGSPRKAESDNPVTWRTYSEACATLAKGHVDGIGYCLMKREGLGALDLDHCRDATSGALEAWASDLIERAQSYTEITPSGEGVRILGFADSSVPVQNFTLPRGGNSQKVEVFHRATRYITLSEKPLDGTPRRLNDISAILLELQAEKDSKKGSKSAANGSQPSGSGTRDESADLIAQILSGDSYHPALTPLSARLVGNGMYPGAAINLLRGLMDAVPPGLQDERWSARRAEIPGLVRSAEEKFSPAHVQIDWPPPLDIIGASEAIGWGELSGDCLPKPLLDYVESEAERLDVDPCPLALHCIAAVATSISDAWSIKMKKHDTKWLEQARIWSCVIKDVGGRGTALLKAAFWPTYKRDARLRAEYAGAFAAWEARKKAAKNDFDEDSDPEPVEERVYTNDPTIEALSDILRNGGDYSKLALIVDELAGLFGGFGRYSGKGAAERAAFLRAYEGGPERIDRVNRGRIFVPNWSLVIAGNIQPRKLAKLGPDLIDDGLFQRFLQVHAKPSEGRGDDDRRMNRTIGVHYGELIETLPKLVPITRGPDGLYPVYVPGEGQAERKRFAQFLNTLRRNSTLPAVVRETASKWTGLHARLTLIFHFVSAVTQQMGGASLVPKDIYAADPATVAMAAKFLEAVALPNLLKLGFETLGDADDNQAQARKLAGVILARKLDSISARGAGRHYRPLRGKVKEAGTVMDVLAAAGWVREADTSRHDSRIWEINPEVHVQFAKQAAAERERGEEIRQLWR